MESKTQRILRELQQERRKRWGTISMLIVAKFLDGKATPEEVLEVRTALEKHSALRDAVESIRRSRERSADFFDRKLR